MNRQELLYLVLGITALFELTVSPLESHSAAMVEFAMYAAAAGVLGTIVVSVLALRNFSDEK